MKRLRMAAFLQFTLPGMASIYYGDEAGAEGYDDPFCRRYYPWGKEDVELRDYFKHNDIPVYLESAAGEIRSDGVTIRQKDGTTKDIPCDSVIVSAGYIPAPVTEKGVHIIGDAKSVGSLRTVIWQAWDVAMKL